MHANCDMQVVFKEHTLAGFFKEKARFDDELDADRHFRDWRDNFQAEHGYLPAEGVDYKRTLEPYEEQYTASTKRVEDGAYAVVSKIRQVLDVTGECEDADLEKRVYYLRDALVRINAICASVAGGAKRPSGRSMAVEIEGISRQAIMEASLGRLS